MSEKKLEMTFPAPKGVKEFKSITIREVDGQDELQAAIWAEAMGRKGDTDQNNKELLRCSIVAVDGKPFNVNGVPNPAFDSWLTKSRNAVGRFYFQLNGLDVDELEACVKKGMSLLPSSSPAQAISDSTEKQNGG
jgi:hypothetical protein